MVLRTSEFVQLVPRNYGTQAMRLWHTGAAELRLQDPISVSDASGSMVVPDPETRQNCPTALKGWAAHVVI